MDGPARRVRARRGALGQVHAPPPAVASSVAAAGHRHAPAPIRLFEVSASRFRTNLDELDSIAARGRAILRFWVEMKRWSREQRRDVAPHFRRFVDRLGRGDFAIDRMFVSLSNWSGLPERDLERLFGQVLPSHPKVRSMTISVPLRFRLLFTESVFATQEPSRLRALSFRGEELTHEDARAIAAMLGRGLALKELTVHPGSMVATEDGRRLCQAAVRHSNIQFFSLTVESLSADTLGLVASSSSLRNVTLRGRFPVVEGVATLATQLRTNTTMTHLHLEHVGAVDWIGPRPNDEELFRPLLEALETCNFTLVAVWVFDAGTPHADMWPGILRRNERLQLALAQMEPRNYRVDVAPVWPLVLGRVSALPTLLYRFLRRGNAKQLLLRHAVLPAAEGNAGGRQKRGRPIDDEGEGEEEEGDDSAPGEG